jgi:cytoskeletal protein RodZ
VLDGDSHVMKRQAVATVTTIIVTLLLGLGIAAALEVDGGTTPATTTSNESSASTASESSSESSSDAESTSSADTHSSDDDASTQSDSTDATESDEAGEHPDNHGKYVSQAAHACPPGPGHGACVSAVAHSDAGKKNK